MEMVVSCSGLYFSVWLSSMDLLHSWDIERMAYREIGRGKTKACSHNSTQFVHLGHLGIKRF